MVDKNIITMRELKFIALLICFMFSISAASQSRVRLAVPNTQRLVKEALAKSRAKKTHKKPMIIISKDFLAKFYGYCGVTIPKDSALTTIADTCSASTQKAMKEAVASSSANEITTLDLLNMIVPGAFSEKEKEQWKALPKETRQAVIGSVLNQGQTQWDGLNEAQKAVIHEQSNAK